MPTPLKHVIVTRFNVATPGRESRIRNRPGWLAHRFELFERFCLPSVAAQTRSDFSWIVYFDPATPDEFKRRIDGYCAHEFFLPLFIDEFSAPRAAADIVAHFSGAADFLLTTRLDNDDALNARFVETLRDALSLDEAAAYNLPNGLVYCGGRLYLRRDEGNPFASYLERFAGAPRTVWSAQHTELERLGPVRQIEARPMWLQVIHDLNVSNRVRGRRIARDAGLRGFPPVADGAPPESAFEIALDGAVLSRMRDAREAFIGAAKAVRDAARGGGPQ